VAADGFDAFGEGFGLEPDSIVRFGILNRMCRSAYHCRYT
jgi:hypothetical protein